MFTGIVEAIGTVAEITCPPAGLQEGEVDPGAAGGRLVVAQDMAAQLQIGESVSVNGCCLTVTDRSDDHFAVDLMGETLVRTTLGRLEAGAPVNLERALAADGRLGGHLVQGHVDGVGTVERVTPHEAWTVVAIAAEERLAPYLVEKGSIAIDGTSLTIMGVRPVEGGRVVFEVGLIPHTLEVTVLGVRRPGDAVNLESDVIAKYVERLVTAGAATPYTTGAGGGS